MLSAAMINTGEFHFDALAVSKKNFPKKPDVGGIPANENNASASTHDNSGLEE